MGKNEMYKMLCVNRLGVIYKFLFTDKRQQHNNTATQAYISLRLSLIF